MIKEAYCSFELSKLLKEKGFNVKTYTYYFKDKREMSYSSYRDNWNGTNNFTSCPTHQMAMAWLREDGFHINVVISYDYSVDADGNKVDRWTFYTFEICSSFSGDLIYTEEYEEFSTYEDAVEASLKYALENLI